MCELELSADAAARRAPAMLAEKALLKRYGHPAVLLDVGLNALHFCGDISPYLEFTEGEPSHRLFRLARKALRPHLRSVVKTALESRQPCLVQGISLGHGEGTRVNLVADPVLDQNGALSALLVVFERPGGEQDAPVATVVETPSDDALITRYEAQLAGAHEDLQRAVQGYETLNEELKASNEELISINEELQTSNEEMDVSREELQSLNEDLQSKVEELAEANGFVENLLKSTNLATVFLDRNRCVMRFTPEARSLFHLLDSDLGRPLSHVRSAFDDERLDDDSLHAMRDVHMVEREIRTHEGKWYLKRVHPYQLPGGDVAGVVITFAEVTQLKEAEGVLLRSKEDLEALVVERAREIHSWGKFSQENPNLVLRVSRDMVITHANRASSPFLECFDVAVGRSFPERFAGVIARTIDTGRVQEFEVAIGETILTMSTIFIPDEGYVNIYGMDITERKRLEAARVKDLAEIRRQRDFLEGLIRNAPMVVGVVEGPDHRYVQANPAYESIVAQACRPMVGRTVREVFPEVGEEVTRLFDSIYATGRPVHMREFEVPLQSRPTWWDADYVPLLDDGGRVSRVLIIGRDVTELVLARTKAEQESIKWRAVIDNLAEGLVLVNGQGDILSINPFGLKMYGFSSASAFPASTIAFKDLFDVRDLTGSPVPKSQWPTARALKGETFSGYELEVLRKDTGQSWIARFKGTPVLDRNGDLLFCLVCFEDITERKRVEKELGNTRLYIEDILNSMPSKVICVESGGRVTHYNTAAASWLADPDAEVLGRQLEHAFPLLAALNADIALAIRERRNVLMEKQPVFSNGEFRYRDVMIYPLSAKDLEGAVLRIDDVTERVRLSELMVQTEKMISVGGLAAGMAHEINNPLASILQSAQVLLMHFDPDREANRKAADECGLNMEALKCYGEKRQVQLFLEGIRDAGKRAAKIVTSMLEFSRKSESRREPVDLNALLEKSLELASRDYNLNKKYDFRHVVIVREYDPNLGQVPCAHTEIEQVVLNLLTNAAQAMAGQGDRGQTPTITLRSRRTEGWAVIEIADNGPGTPEAVRKRVFEPFFTTKEPGTGTGLGLSVSYFIITSNHGGTIDMESQPGQGSTFTIRLPLIAGTLAKTGVSA